MLFSNAKQSEYKSSSKVSLLAPLYFIYIFATVESKHENSHILNRCKISMLYLRHGNNTSVKALFTITYILVFKNSNILN